MDRLYRRICHKAVWCAYRAGKLMLDRDGLEVGNKGTKENYVTSKDLQVQRFLRKELGEALPGSAFMGEEADLPGEGDVPEAGRPCWVVDPIDGTANYARDMGESVVSIALVVDGMVEIGVVYNPYTQETFAAVRGQGAFRNGVPIRVSDRPKENCMVCTSWSAYDKSRAPVCFRISQRLYAVCEDLRRTGTAAYELCMLARGVVDMHFEIRLAPWDYAAASLIVEEAGGFTGSLNGPLDLQRQCLVMAANTRENFDFLRGIVSEEVAPPSVGRSDESNRLSAIIVANYGKSYE